MAAGHRFGLAVPSARLRAGVPLLPEHGGQNLRFRHGAAALLSPAVVVEFRARPGGALIPRRAPPVVFVAVAVDALLRDAHLVPPDLEDLVVIQVDGDEQALRGQSEPLGNHLPGVGHGPFLEVIADAEVAQHFEEGQVLVVAHFVDVGGPEALLAAGQPAGGRGLLPSEEGLERDHAGAGEQKGGVARRDQRRAGHVQMPLALKELDEGVPDLIAVHCPAFGLPAPSRPCPTDVPEFPKQEGKGKSSGQRRITLNCLELYATVE